MVYQGHDFRGVRTSEELTIDEERRGIGCSPGRVRGPVRVVTDPRSVDLRQRSILVAAHTDPGWVMVFPSALGVLVERGSLLSHAAIVARELGIPAIVSVPGLSGWLKDGDWVEFDGASGSSGASRRRTCARSAMSPETVRADFSRIRYAQVWEDADVLLEALDVRPGDVYVSIASAGDNALALLTEHPARVIAIDVSAQQIACLQLRVAAYRELTHGELLELVGSRPSTRRAALYARCRPALPPPRERVGRPVCSDRTRDRRGRKVRAVAALFETTSCRSSMRGRPSRRCSRAEACRSGSDSTQPVGHLALAAVMQAVLLSSGHGAPWA